MNLYQLAANQNLQKGTLVNIGGPYHKHGRIIETIQEDFEFPNKCMFSGATRYHG
jgi:hypothetical protein